MISYPMAIVADSCLLIIVSDNIQIALLKLFFQPGHSNVQTAIHAVISWLERGSLIAKAGLEKTGASMRYLPNYEAVVQWRHGFGDAVFGHFPFFSTPDGIDITGDVGMLQVENTA